MPAYLHLARKISFFAVCVAVLSLTVVVSAAAPKKSTSQQSSGSSQDISQAVSQSYTASDGVQQGMIVRLKAKSTAVVEPVLAADVKSMLGVIVPNNASPITLTPETVKAQQVLVARQGRFEVLVSNQNGVIKNGDYITVSAVAGIGMRADENQSTILGTAIGSFNGTANVIGSVVLKDKLGKTSTVSISHVLVNLNIEHNPLEQKSTDFLPSFLAKAATVVANKPVSTARIILGLAALIVTAFVTGTVVYSGVRSGIVAIGRNPLSKQSIIKGLVQTVIAGLIIFIAGVFAVYLLLKL